MGMKSIEESGKAEIMVLQAIQEAERICRSTIPVRDGRKTRWWKDVHKRLEEAVVLFANYCVKDEE